MEKDYGHTSDKDVEVATSEEFGVVSREPLPGNKIMGSRKTYGKFPEKFGPPTSTLILV